MREQYDTEKVDKYLKQVIRYDPCNAHGHWLMGCNIKKQQGDMKIAFRHFEEAIKNAERNSERKLWRGSWT
jgi:cytochrome c-type biogenesis protein CcmH/NrfG